MKNPHPGMRFNSLLALTVLANLGMGIVMPILPIYFKQYDVTIAALGAPYATLVAGRLFSRLIGPRFILRCGHRVAVMGGFFLYALVFVAYLRADSIVLFGALRFLEGIVEGMLAVALNDLAIAYTKGAGSEQRVRLMGRFGSAFGLGFLLGPLAGSAVAYAFGLRAIFIAGALVGAAAVVLSALMLVNAPPSVKPFSVVRGRVKETALLIGLYSPQSLRRLVFFSLMILLPLHVSDQLRLGSEYVGLFFAASAVLTTLLMPVSANVTKRIGVDVTVSWGLCTMAACLLGLGLLHDPVTFAIVFVVETVAFSLMLPPAMAIFSEAVENHADRTKILGTMTFVTELLSFPPAFLLPVFYSIHPALAWGAVALLSMFAFILFGRSRRSLTQTRVDTGYDAHLSPLAPDQGKQEQA